MKYNINENISSFQVEPLLASPFRATERARLGVRKEEVEFPGSMWCSAGLPLRYYASIHARDSRRCLRNVCETTTLAGQKCAYRFTVELYRKKMKKGSLFLSSSRYFSEENHKVQVLTFSAHRYARAEGSRGGIGTERKSTGDTHTTRNRIPRVRSAMPEAARLLKCECGNDHDSQYVRITFADRHSALDFTITKLQ